MSDSLYPITSESGQRMLSYVAPIYYQSYVAMAIFQINGAEVDDLKAWTAEIKGQLFPQSATWGLKYWENELGIQINETLPIETRRQAILSKLVTRMPVTQAKIEEIAQQNTGMKCIIQNRISANTFRVIIENSGNGLDLEALNKAIDVAKPAHLTAEYGVQYTKEGVKVSGNMSVAGRGPLFKCGIFRCGTRPYGTTRIEQTVEYRSSVEMATQIEPLSGIWKTTGTFNCGREVT